MVVVPGLIPVINPVFETVATCGLLDVQALLIDAVPLPVSCRVELVQTKLEPLIVGLGFTIMGRLALQPKLFI